MPKSLENPSGKNYIWCSCYPSSADVFSIPCTLSSSYQHLPHHCFRLYGFSLSTNHLLILYEFADVPSSQRPLSIHLFWKFLCVIYAYSYSLIHLLICHSWLSVVIFIQNHVSAFSVSHLLHFFQCGTSVEYYCGFHANMAELRSMSWVAIVLVRLFSSNWYLGITL